MKFKKSGQTFLALAVSLGLSIGLTSCANDYTVGYLYVTGSYQSQIGAFKIASNTGNLSAIPGSPFGSGGSDPVRAIVSTTGRYLYVLNAGAATPDPANPDNTIYKAANITVYSVGGNGTLAPQQSYTSQGFGSFRFAFNPSGTFLYVLDEYSPAAGGTTGAATQLPGMSCLDSSSVYHPTGDITAFSVDSNTGRLSLVTNNQVQGANGTALPYFPVGCQPLDLKVTGANALVADTTDPVTGNKYTVFPYAMSLSTGQLTVTQNTEFVTGAASISTIGSDAASKYIYILDPVSDSIWYYTIGANGLLQAVNGSPTLNSQSTAGNPVALASDSKSKFLYVANAGPPSTSVTQPASDLSAYTIAANGVLAVVAGAPFHTGSGPQCVIEDPSNQYLYTADFNTNTVTGHVLDPNSGVLTDLRNQSSYPTVGNPTWCVADGHTD
jgi:6-phosphogluconolactonase (cycloisomerase 2 family)